MKPSIRAVKAVFATVGIVLVQGGLSSIGLGQQPVAYNRDVKPILAARCFACHGPDEAARQAGLRLDLRESAIDLGAIVPGQAGDSELIRRIQSSDETEVMPPPHVDRAVTAAEQAVLRAWIEAGADYQTHWAFVPPQRPILPATKASDWILNPIDTFVLARLEREGWSPAPRADRYTLVRRLYLDLIGLPPTMEQADAFVESNDPAAYEQLVDQLLASPRYGEHWAQSWLDLARYADTNGYEKDRPRSIWPYRDWVIRALNRDLPYDQFSIDQLAGDMLPEPTVDQRIATGFHRNTMLNEEGGIDPLEYRFLSMVDRVATTGTVWLGLTTGCAQCHTHKYDPISHTDYYRFMALMNNADEPDFAIPDAVRNHQREEQEQTLQQMVAGLAEQFPVPPGEGPKAERRRQHLESEFSDWLDQSSAQVVDWKTLAPTRWTTNLPRLEVLEDDSVFSSGDITKRDQFDLTFHVPDGVDQIRAIRLEALPDSRLPANGPGRTYYEGRKGDFFVSELTAESEGQSWEFSGGSCTSSEPLGEASNRLADRVFDGDGSTGWLPGNRKGERLQLVLKLKQPWVRTAGATGDFAVRLLFERHYAVSLGRFRLSVTADADAVAVEFPETVERQLLQVRLGQEGIDSHQLMTYFLNTTPLLAEARKPIDELRGRLVPLVETMVMVERPAANPRPTFRHHRGEYLNPREPVEPGIMSVFAPLTSPVSLPGDRMELAQWLVSESNPLVARVAVNRIWRALFGEGLVRTDGDFGVQAPPPTHPELLDWLAVEVRQQGWSMKQLQKMIVMSATYQQASDVPAESYRRDPENRWLGRGPRFRVPGEMIRDMMLQASGLLSDKMFGPGVRPPQPASVTALAYGDTSWPAATGDDRYRRSIYTFKKRTAAFAAYTVFDGNSGEACVARRSRSNTPLQALTVLNDEMYVEMARGLASAAIGSNADRSPAEVVDVMFRRVLTRPPTVTERSALMTFFETQRSRFEQGQLDTAKFCDDAQATPDRAAWVMVARVLMNLDEAIVKQ